MSLERFLDFRERLAEGWREQADHELADLLSAAVVDLATPVPAGCALVATGGFGRGSMALRSDVDLLFLHAGGEPAELIRAVLRPLWDANLKVGQMAHTTQGARQAAASRIDTMCSFLTARLLVGDETLFGDFSRRVRREARKGRSRGLLAQLQDEDRRRRELEPYRLMSFDLKRGRGGIRSLDVLDLSRRLELGFDIETPEAEAAARSYLNAVRSGLHARSGRPHDVYDFELREPVARYLGVSVRDVGRRLLEVRQVSDSPSKAGNSPQARGRSGQREMISLLRTTDREPATVAAMIPEFERLQLEPHLVAFHRYPVADHSLAAVDQARRLLDGQESTPALREVVASLADPDMLLWAALLHDVGKGLEGDHSRAGAGLIPDLGAKLGFDDERVERLRGLVEHHLLLADLAVRWDLDDPSVVAWAADRIGDVESLRLLYLLTVADSRATGSDTWTPWRAELVQRAYRRVEQELVRRSLPETVVREVLTDQVLGLGPGLDRSEVVSHLAGLTDAYRSSHSPEVIREHVLMAREPIGPLGIQLRVGEGHPIRIIVSTQDRPGLMMAMAGVMAVHRLSVLDARFATRADGRVFDTLEVVDAGAGMVDSARLDLVEVDLARMVRGGFSIEEELAARRHAYRDARRQGVVPNVDIIRSDDGGGRVEIECADRVALLHDLGGVFARLRMPVTRARVDTRGGMAYDTFYVSRLPADATDLIRALMEVMR